MKKNSECDYEHSVVKSLKSEFINEEIAGHIESCANCREAAKVVRFFQTNLSKEPKPKKLPAAGLVWWKSRLREKQRAAKLISKPIFYVQTAAALIFVGVFIWLFNSGALQSTLLNSALDRLFNSMEQVAFPIIVGIVSIASISLLLAYVLKPFTAEK